LEKPLLKTAVFCLTNSIHLGMKNYLAITFVFLLLACNNEADKNKTEDSEGNVSFFPTASFFAGQVKMIDSLQLPVLKFVTRNGHTDTTQISTRELGIMAADFLQTDLSDPDLRKSYKEESFADQSISSITLTYSTKNRDLPVQRMDVLINPDPVMNDKVRSIYIEKLEKHGDTSVLKKMYWKTDKHFLVISSAKAANDTPVITQLRVQWDQ